MITILTDRDVRRWVTEDDLAIVKIEDIIWREPIQYSNLVVLVVGRHYRILKHRYYFALPGQENALKVVYTTDTLQLLIRDFMDQHTARPAHV